MGVNIFGYLLVSLVFFFNFFCIAQSQESKPIGLSYYKNTCSEEVFKNLTLDKAYNLLHFDQKNNYGRFLSYSFCQTISKKSSALEDYLLIERALLRGELVKKIILNPNHSVVHIHKEKIYEIYQKFGADINNIFRTQVDLLDLKKGIEPFPNIPSQFVEFTYSVENFDEILTNNYGKDSWKKPLDVSKIFLGINKIIAQQKINRIEPFASRIHSYSPEFLKWKDGKILNPNTEIQERIQIKTRLSKLLTALATGTTSVFLLTSKEDSLTSWMLLRDDRSIDIFQIFEQSYILNKGDLYLTLLTIENVLSKNWLTVGRNSLPLMKKLVPLTYQDTTEGDKFGAWYHFFGMALFGLAEGSASANLVAFTEAMMSMVDASNPVSNDIQEAYINFHGARFGSLLRKMLKGKIDKKYENLEIDKSQNSHALTS